MYDSENRPLAFLILRKFPNISHGVYTSLIALVFILLPVLILDIMFLNVKQAVFISDFGFSSKIQWELTDRN